MQADQYLWEDIPGKDGVNTLVTDCWADRIIKT